MSALLVAFGVKATRCVVANHHSPVPLRYVWHHVLPQGAGGQTVPDNLVQVCDSCHYAIHALLYQMAQNAGKLTTLKKHAGTSRAAIAMRGYQAALTAGTVSAIPNEGVE